MGMPRDSKFVRWISQGDNAITFEELREEVVATAVRFTQRRPEVGAIVCECTNLAPFSRAIFDRIGMPVFDVVTMVNWFQAGIARRIIPIPERSGAKSGVSHA
jgi:hypothetical protein